MESEFILNLKEISIQTILIALLNFGLTMLIKWPIKKVTAKKEENKRKAINTIIVFIPMLLSFVLSLMYYGIFENKWLDELVYETTANSYIFTVAIYAIYSRIVILIKGIGGTEQTSDNAVLSKEMIGYLKSNIKTISKTLKIDEKNLSRIVTEFDHLISIRNEITSNTLFQDISQTERLDNQLNQLEKQKNELTQSVANMQTQIANYQATLKKEIRMQTIIIDPLKTQYSIQNVEFCDRERKLGYENRKYINIVKQTADQMEADIIDYPLDSTEKAGTAINAQLMNNIKEVIKQSDDNSRTAHQVAQVAYNNSIEAYNVSEQAKTNAEESLSKSNSTQAALLLLSEQVEAKQGTIVTVGGNRITEGVFEANTKLDVTTYNEDKALINQKLNTLENKEIIKNVTYDATTETFII